MSRTTRKYPTYKCLNNGIVYDNSADLPRVTRYYRAEVREQIEDGVSWRYGKLFDDDGLFIRVGMIEYKYSRFRYTGEFKQVPYTVHEDCEWISDYGVKVREDHKHRSGVGKECKQIRSRKHRAQAKHAIDQWKQENFDVEVPVEKNHDRWDRW